MVFSLAFTILRSAHLVLKRAPKTTVSSMQEKTTISVVCKEREGRNSLLYCRLNRCVGLMVGTRQACMHHCVFILKSIICTGEINGNAMTPSSRVSAINIVGDLLRKVGVSQFIELLVQITVVLTVVVITVEFIGL